MQSKQNSAVQKLHEENLCCVVLRGGDCFTSTEFGIKPLMTFLRQDKRFFEGAVIADKIVGKAAALLMVLGGAAEVYGEIMSESAIEVLKAHQIPFGYGKTVPYIKNRTDTGMCPMEETVKDITAPAQAFDALEVTIAALMKAK